MRAFPRRRLHGWRDTGETRPLAVTEGRTHAAMGHAQDARLVLVSGGLKNFGLIRMVLVS
jgi:hypothetical protein